MGVPRDGDVRAADDAAATTDVGDRVVAQDVTYDWDLVTDEIRWKASLAEVIGLDDERLTTGLGWAEHLVAESPSSRYEAVTAGGTDTGGGVAFHAIYGLRPVRRSGAAPVWIEDEGRWFGDAAGRPVRAQGSIRLAADPFEADGARAAGQRDQVTGAFTRARFLDHVTRHLRLAGARTSTFAVLAIAVEPEQGALADDAAMAEAFARLRPEMRFNEVVAREDATRFAALLETCNADQAAAAAHRFIAAIEHGGSPVLRARIGAVLAPSSSSTSEALLQAAGEALAGATGTPGFLLLDREAARGTAPLRDDVLAALNEGRVVLALRPVVAATTYEPVLHEGLVRIMRSDGRLVPADAMIGGTMEDSLATALERRVLDLAIGMLAADRRLRLSIDVSLAALGGSAWIEHLRAAARLRADVVRRLTLAIAESEAVADVEATCAALAAARACGAKLALDGFGSARSSFRTLRRLEADFLKIDGALTRNVGTDAVDRNIRDMVELAQNLAVRTIAQGVADEAEARALARLGVSHLQGDLFAQPDILARPDIAPSPRPAVARA